MMASFTMMTTLAVLAVGLTAVQGRTFTNILEVSNGGSWGNWHREQFCPAGTFATGFELRVEPYQGTRGDDSAANAVRLYCTDQSHTLVTTVSSYNGLWGDWTGRKDCNFDAQNNYYLTAFQLKVEGYQGTNGDDSAMNSIKMRCTEGGADIGYPVEGQGGGWGNWGTWSNACEKGSAICGIAAKFEPYQGTNGDDSALNDVKMYCCPLEDTSGRRGDRAWEETERTLDSDLDVAREKESE